MWHTGNRGTHRGQPGGAAGDLYIDTASGDVYVNVAGTWGAAPIFNMQGDPGAGINLIGEDTLANIQALPAGGLQNGDGYIVTDLTGATNPLPNGDVVAVGDLVLWDGTQWDHVAHIVGPQGTVGPAPNITVGTVTSLAAGATPTVALTGSGATGYTMDLGIPAGATGARGSRWYTTVSQQTDVTGGSAVILPATTQPHAQATCC